MSYLFTYLPGGTASYRVNYVTVALGTGYDGHRCWTWAVRTSENPGSRHSGEAISTVAHPPKLGHIGQTVNARGFTYATCHALQTLVARLGKIRGSG